MTDIERWMDVLTGVAGTFWLGAYVWLWLTRPTKAEPEA